jgi:hypothetical protein
VLAACVRDMFAVNVESSLNVSSQFFTEVELSMLSLLHCCCLSGDETLVVMRLARLIAKNQQSQAQGFDKTFI